MSLKWCGVKATAVTWGERGQPVHAAFGPEKEGNKVPENTLLCGRDKALKQ